MVYVLGCPFNKVMVRFMFQVVPAAKGYANVAPYLNAL